MLGHGVVVLALCSACWELVTLAGQRGQKEVWEVVLFLERDPSSSCPLPGQAEPFVLDTHQMAQGAKTTCLAAAALLSSIYSWIYFIVSLDASLK